MIHKRGIDVPSTARVARRRSGRLDRLLHQAVRTEPAKVRPGYANFAIAEPPLKLVLIEGRDEPTIRLDHLGVEVEHSDQVGQAAHRLTEPGPHTTGENDTACCHAVQHQVWVTGPGNEPWEVYMATGDTDTLTKAENSICCNPNPNQTAQPDQTPSPPNRPSR